jgi:hypothetical protein
MFVRENKPAYFHGRISSSPFTDEFPYPRFSCFSLRLCVFARGTDPPGSLTAQPESKSTTLKTGDTDSDADVRSITTTTTVSLALH